MTRLRRKISAKVFYRIVLVLSIAVALPVFFSGWISIRHSTTHIVSQAGLSGLNLLREKTQMIERSFAAFEYLANVLFSSAETQELIDSGEIDAHEYHLMAAIIKDITGVIIDNGYIRSIYLIDFNHSLVVSDVKYDMDDFADREILSSLGEQERGILPPRNLEGHTVLSVYKKFNTFPSNMPFYVMFNLGHQALFDDIFASDSRFQLGVVITNEKGTPMYVTSGLPEVAALVEQLDATDTEGRTREIPLSGQTWVVNEMRSQWLGWNMFHIQPYEELVEPAKLVRNLILSSLAVVLLISVAGALFITVWICRPLRELVDNVKGYLSDASQTGYENEYRVIRGAIRELHHRFEITLPVFQEHSLADIMLNGSFDIEQFNELLELLGVQFVHPHNFAGILHFENAEVDDDTKTVLENALNNASGELVAVYSRITRKKVLLIGNTRLDDPESRIADIHRLLNSKNLQVTIAITGTYTNIRNTESRFRTALSLIESKFFLGTNRIIKESDIVRPRRSGPYSHESEEELLDAVRSCNTDKAVSRFNSISDELSTARGSVDYIRYIYFQIALNLHNAVVELGCENGGDKFTARNIFRHIKGARTVEQLDSYIHRLIESCIDLVNGLRSRQRSIMVGRAIDFIDENYRRDLALDEISGTAFVTTRYLCDIFKHETGKTVYEYITDKRMETARSELVTTRKKIKDISRSVGYNSIQSFLTYFKRYFNMTPGQYRRSKGFSV